MPSLSTATTSNTIQRPRKANAEVTVTIAAADRGLMLFLRSSLQVQTLLSTVLAMPTTAIATKNVMAIMSRIATIPNLRCH